MEIPSLRETSLASPATGLKTSSKIPKAQRSQLDPGGPPRLCRGCTSDKSPCQAFIPTSSYSPSRAGPRLPWCAVHRRMYQSSL